MSLKHIRVKATLSFALQIWDAPDQSALKWEKLMTFAFVLRFFISSDIFFYSAEAQKYGVKTIKKSSVKWNIFA